MSPDDLPTQTQLQAGSTTFNGPRQFFAPKPIIIGLNSGSGTATGERTNLRITLPSSQCRAKLSVFFVPTGGLPFANIAGIGTIWVSAQEQDQKGISGGGGGYYDVNDLEGTAAAPTAFPTSAGLSGYSREFVSSADAIGAQVTLDSIQGGNTHQGVWVAQARIEPFAVLFDHGTWDQLRRLFTFENLGPRLVL